MTILPDSLFWSESRSSFTASVKAAFQALPPRYFLAAALFLPLALVAWACRFVFAWAFDSIASRMPSSAWQGSKNRQQADGFEQSQATMCGQVPQKA